MSEATSVVYRRFQSAFQCFSLQFPKTNAKTYTVYSAALTSHFQSRCNLNLGWFVWYYQLANLDAPQTCWGHLQPATQHFIIKPWKSSTKWNEGASGRSWVGFPLPFFYFFSFQVLCLSGDMSWLTCCAWALWQPEDTAISRDSDTAFSDASRRQLPSPQTWDYRSCCLCLRRGTPEELGRQAGRSSHSPA